MATALDQVVTLDDLAELVVSIYEDDEATDEEVKHDLLVALEAAYKIGVIDGALGR